MKILPGRRVKNFREAVDLAFREAGVDDRCPSVADLVESADAVKLHLEAEKDIVVAIRGRYRVSDMLKRKSVATWLKEFGSQGRSVMPLVVSTLLGLQSMGTAGVLPLGEQQWTYEQLLSTLEAMAYQPSEAREMVACAMPYLRADQTLGEAIRIILQNEAKGG